MFTFLLLKFISIIKFNQNIYLSLVYIYIFSTYPPKWQSPEKGLSIFTYENQGSTKLINVFLCYNTMYIPSIFSISMVCLTFLGCVVYWWPLTACGCIGQHKGSRSQPAAEQTRCLKLLPSQSPHEPPHHDPTTLEAAHAGPEPGRLIAQCRHWEKWHAPDLPQHLQYMKFSEITQQLTMVSLH